MGMKVVGIALIVVALLAGVVPVLNNCTAEGLYITTQDGRQIDMKCYWTSRASIVLAVPLGLAGVMLAVSRRKETRRVLGLLAIVLSAGLIALPTEAIGVCAMDKSCSEIMRPALIVLGVAGIALGGAALALSNQGSKDAEVES